MTSKPTNPKDIIGSGKLPLELVPDSMVAYASLSFLEGALKYGRFNWRAAGVRSSIYVAAAKRHLAKWWNGEECDPDTKVPHLSSVLACIAIIIDADVSDQLNDDRPPKQRLLPGMIDNDLQELASHLREHFKDHDPKQYTIWDTLPDQEDQETTRLGIELPDPVSPNDPLSVPRIRMYPPL